MADVTADQVVQTIGCTAAGCTWHYGVVSTCPPWQIQLQAVCTGWKVSATEQMLCPEHAHLGDDLALRRACERWWLAYQQQQGQALRSPSLAKRRRGR